MKVLSIFYKDKRGGFTRRLCRLLDSMAKEGHSVFFIGSRPMPLEGPGVFQDIIRAPCRDRENIIFWLSFILLSSLKAFRVAKRHGIDRIITFGPFYTALCFLPILLLRIPAVTFIRADNMKHGRNRARNVFFYLIDRVGIRMSRRTLFVSEALMGVYRSRYDLPVEKLDVVPNNADQDYRVDPDERSRLRNHFGISDDAFLISTCGVFVQGKNFDFLIRSMGELGSNRAKLIIIGDEPVPNGERERLEKIAVRSGVKDQVFFSGWLSDPRPLIASSDLFVFPSTHEGSPNALLETLGCGVPCLGSNVEGVREVLGYRKLLFSLDTHRELVRKLRKSIFDPEFYQKLRMLTFTRYQVYLFDWEKRVRDAILE
ncbi:MAG: glycosyltransferase family 4 protein [Deltaproteobacteria bacterium]|nr:glycosyltransferase family 4 protein [Deltaproteobacteria bacterium]MBW2017592.1 glycosyltransferase family 4 protein [Deltaproteobacteria bacterium]